MLRLENCTALTQYHLQIQKLWNSGIAVVHNVPDWPRRIKLRARCDVATLFLRTEVDFLNWSIASLPFDFNEILK